MILPDQLPEKFPSGPLRKYPQKVGNAADLPLNPGLVHCKHDDKKKKERMEESVQMNLIGNNSILGQYSTQAWAVTVIGKGLNAD